MRWKMELIIGNEIIECDACGNEITLAIKFLNKLYENEDVIVCSNCISTGVELIILYNQQCEIA